MPADDIIASGEVGRHIVNESIIDSYRWACARNALYVLTLGV